MAKTRRKGILSSQRGVFVTAERKRHLEQFTLGAARLAVERKYSYNEVLALPDIRSQTLGVAPSIVVFRQSPTLPPG